MEPIETEVVQPDEGQGGEPGGAPYAAYLDRIPQELRGDVEPVFKDWDSSVTKRFQALSESGRRWEPYEQAGLHEYDPQSLSRLVEFAQMAEQDPAAYTDWLREQAQAAGILTPSEPIEDSYVDPAIEKLLEQHLGPLQQQVQQFQSWQQEQEFSRAQQAENQRIQTRLAELREQHGEFPEPFIEKLTANYVHADPHNAVDRAFADYQALRAEIEKGVFASKLAQPGTPEMTGVADAQPQPVTTMKEAAALATERLRQQNRS